MKIFDPDPKTLRDLLLTQHADFLFFFLISARLASSFSLMFFLDKLQRTSAAVNEKHTICGDTRNFATCQRYRN